MILTTTNTLETHPIKGYLGIVSGETIIGANIFKDFFAGIRDIVGGRSGSYEKVLREAKEIALKEIVLSKLLITSPSRSTTGFRIDLPSASFRSAETVKSPGNWKGILKTGTLSSSRSIKVCLNSGNPRYSISSMR